MSIEQSEILVIGVAVLLVWNVSLTAHMFSLNNHIGEMKKTINDNFQLSNDREENLQRRVKDLERTKNW